MGLVTMIDYTEFQNLTGIYLEDSYVLDIIQGPGEILFKMEVVLTPEHPNYYKPRAGEQYCYAAGDLIFDNASRVEWLERSTNRYIDAAGDEDLGNIDSLTADDDGFVVEGDWGRVRIRSACQPRFELVERNDSRGP